MNVLYHHRTRGVGAECVHILGVFDAFKKRGHKAAMLSFPGVNPSLESKVDPNKAAIKSKSPLKVLANLTQKMPQALFELFELGYNLYAIPRLIKSIRKNESELVYERYSLFMFAGVMVAKMLGKKIVIEVNDSALVHRVRPLKFKRLAQFIEKRVFSRVDGVVFISDYFQSLAQDEYKNVAPSVVSPNAANLDHFPTVTDSERASVRQQLGISDDKIVVGYVGAFVHWHGIDWFTQKIAPQLKSNPNIVMLLVGDGVCYDAIANVIKEHDVADQCVLPGRVAHTEVNKYLSVMDVGILPDSNLYGSPMKLFEFMAMGVPMVAPNFGPIAEIIEDGKTGWMFNANEHQECVDTLLRVCNEASHIKQVGINARDYIVESRQWTHNVDDIMKIVDESQIHDSTQTSSQVR